MNAAKSMPYRAPSCPARKEMEAAPARSDPTAAGPQKLPWLRRRHAHSCADRPSEQRPESHRYRWRPPKPAPARGPDRVRFSKPAGPVRRAAAWEAADLAPKRLLRALRMSRIQPRCFAVLCACVFSLEALTRSLTQTTRPPQKFPPHAAATFCSSVPRSHPLYSARVAAGRHTHLIVLRSGLTSYLE